MAANTGKVAKVTLGSHTVLNLTTYTLNIDGPLLEEPVFADEWMQTIGQAVKSWGGTVEGLVDLADTTGQIVLEAAALAGTKITNIRFYLDATNYWASDTAGDADAGVYISNWNSSAGANDITRVSFDFRGHGKCHRTS